MAGPSVWGLHHVSPHAVRVNGSMWLHSTCWGLVLRGPVMWQLTWHPCWQSDHSIRKRAVGGG